MRNLCLINLYLLSSDVLWGTFMRFFMLTVCWETDRVWNYVQLSSSTTTTHFLMLITLQFWFTRLWQNIISHFVTFVWNWQFLAILWFNCIDKLIMSLQISVLKIQSFAHKSLNLSFIFVINPVPVPAYNKMSPIVSH